LGISLADVNATLSTAWGSAYVNDFMDSGQIKKVYIQAEPDARMMPEDLAKWYVRNKAGDMVPFTAFVDTEWSSGSPRLERYNGTPSMQILGSPAPGVSSGQAMAEIEALARRLPPGIGYEWTGLSYEERASGSQAPMLYALSLIVVFLCLAALYESWSIPVSVMMVVPLGLLGAVLASLLRGLPNDVYFQVGLLTTIGLSSKNAILIVEFARHLYDDGMDLVEATKEAARQRLRPIIMTSMAFMLGVLPLAISTGAGAGGRIAIGTSVIGGMLTATVLAVFFVPLFFWLIVTIFARKRHHHGGEPATTEAGAEAGT
ncbi:MAG TPA: efflux RND transporter permease subunit, partial [Kaistiaceae bacterium]|nr:efflux RND transporter permease subunit [Kaistiaceae bacterium]